jgi:drug/metabolite transporter (DMT)-like permease
MSAERGRGDFFGAVAQARLMLVLTTLFWGGNAVAGKFAVGEVSPFVLTFLRWALAAALVALLARPHLRRDWPIIRKRLPYLAAMGAMGFTVFAGLLYYGLVTTTAINATIIQAAMPMFIFVLNFVIFRTATTKLQALGYSLTLLGVALAAGRGDLSGLLALDFDRGDLLIILAAVTYAGYSVALREKPVMHWLSFLTVLFVTGALASLPFVAFEMAAGAAIWPRTPTAWTVIAFVTIFPSLLAQAFFIRGNEVLGSNAAGLFLNLIPIMGALLSIMLLGERFQLFHAASLALVLGGIALAQRRHTSGSASAKRS